MNRQIISFLSLFSLVLVLSIYYVLMPLSQGLDGDDEIVDIEDSTTLYFATLHLARETYWDDLKTVQNSVIASAVASNQEKAVALEDISAIEAAMNLETTAVNHLKEIGFEAAYVEVNGKIVTIIVGLDEPTKTDAVSVFRSIYETLGAEVAAELTFHS